MARDYVPNDQGLRDVGTSRAMQEFVMQAAEVGRSFAQSADPTGEGEYHVVSHPGLIGWKNENRVGAMIQNRAENRWYVENEFHVLSRSVNAIEG